MVDVLVASWLEPAHVARIAAAAGALDVHYAPDLLPRPAYPCDHDGPVPQLGAADLRRWQALLARAEIAFDADWWRPADLPTTAPRLRWVQLSSAGVGAFLARTGLDRTGIVFTTAAGVHAVPLAEFVVAGVLQLLKDLRTLSVWQAERHWERHATGQLRGRRALVVGLGGIGREVVRVLDALGVHTTGCGRDDRTYDVPGLARVVTVADLDRELPRTDIVVLACPLTDRTRNLLSAERIARLPTTAIVVNIARGAVLDEPALTAALAGGRLGGAVLDVFATEPLPPASPLWALPNVIISPHSASTVATENDRLVDLFCDNLRRFTEGQPLRNVYDASRGY